MWLKRKQFPIVTINYKSGISITGRFETFSVQRGVYEWKGAPNKKYPFIVLQLGADEIESIFYKVGY